VRDLLGREHLDEVLVSTPPARGLSRWLHTDLSHRLARSVRVPVEHLERHG